MRCLCWDRPFYLLLLLLANFCQADCRVTTLVPSDYLLSLVSFLSICDKKLEGYVRCRCWDGPFYLMSLLSLGTSCQDYFRVTKLVPTDSNCILSPLLYLCDERLGVLNMFCNFLNFFVVIVLAIPAETLIA